MGMNKIRMRILFVVVVVLELAAAFNGLTCSRLRSPVRIRHYAQMSDEPAAEPEAEMAQADAPLAQAPDAPLPGDYLSRSFASAGMGPSSSPSNSPSLTEKLTATAPFLGAFALIGLLASAGIIK